MVWVLGPYAVCQGPIVVSLNHFSTRLLAGAKTGLEEEKVEQARNGFTDLLQMEIQGEALNMFGKDLDQPRMEKVIQEVEDLCVV